jgi:hypothetical protein
MPEVHYKQISYNFPNRIFMIQIMGLQPEITVKINNQTLRTQAGCLCVYSNQTDVLYYAAYNDSTFQESGYLRINQFSNIQLITLDSTNKNFINYNFPVAITPLQIKNAHFNPDVKNPSPDNHWLLYVTHGIEPSDLDVFIGCRDSLQSDKLWVFNNDISPKYFFIARNEEGELITHTGKRNPVYPYKIITFNIDDNIIIPLNYDFTDTWFGNSKLFVNNCNPLTTFKSCTNLKWCRKYQIIDGSDSLQTPQHFIYDICTGEPTDYSDNNGIVKDIILKSNRFYSFTIQEQSGTEIIYSDYSLTKPHKLIHITEARFANIKFNFIVNNGNLNIADVDEVSVQLRGYCNETENCTENSDLFNKKWDDIREFIKDPLLKKLYIGKYNLKLYNNTTGQVILNEHYTFCGDTIRDVYFTFHDFTNYIDCKLALPNFPNQQIDNIMVRSDGELTYDPYLWYSVRIFDPNPQNLLTLYPGDRCDNKMVLDWSKHEYYTFSANVKSTLEYFVQASIEWWHEDEYTSYHTTYGDIASTADTHDVYITTQRPDDYKTDDYVVLKINRVNDPYNNIPISEVEEYRIGKLNYYWGNKRIFESPCLHITDDCYFLWNGVPSYLFGIYTQPIEEEMLSKVAVEKFTNNDFDGAEFGKASYEETTIKIPCEVRIGGRPVKEFESQFEAIFREYLFNRRNMNGLLKQNYLQVSYSDRIYRGFISGAQNIKIDNEKGTGSFDLELTVPEGIFYEQYLIEYGVGNYKQLKYNQKLLPVIWLKIDKPGILNLKITDILSNKTMLLAGFNITAVDENTRIVIDVPNKKVYYNRVDITKLIPFLYGWLELDSNYNLEISEGYSIEGVFGGQLRTKNY